MPPRVNRGRTRPAALLWGNGIPEKRVESATGAGSCTGLSSTALNWVFAFSNGKVGFTSQRSSGRLQPSLTARISVKRGRPSSLVSRSYAHAHEDMRGIDSILVVIHGMIVCVWGFCVPVHATRQLAKN